LFEMQNRTKVQIIEETEGPLYMEQITTIKILRMKRCLDK
jgi:hypothetical protein